MSQLCELSIDEIFFETFVKSDGFQIAFFMRLDIMRPRSRQRSPSRFVANNCRTNR
jgi:hypothetical protein